MLHGAGQFSDNDPVFSLSFFSHLLFQPAYLSHLLLISQHVMFYLWFRPFVSELTWFTVPAAAPPPNCATSPSHRVTWLQGEPLGNRWGHFDLSLGWFALEIRPGDQWPIPVCSGEWWQCMLGWQWRMSSRPASCLVGTPCRSESRRLYSVMKCKPALLLVVYFLISSTNKDCWTDFWNWMNEKVFSFDVQM